MITQTNTDLQLAVANLVAQLSPHGEHAFYILEHALRTLCEVDKMVTLDNTIVYQTPGYLRTLERNADEESNVRLRRDIHRHQLQRLAEIRAAESYFEVRS